MCPHLEGATLVKSRLFFATLALFVVVSAARIVTAQDAEAAKVKNPIASTPESIAAGQVVFRKCAPCHGNMGQGGPGNDLIPAAPSLVDDMWDHGATDGGNFASFPVVPLSPSMWKRARVEMAVYIALPFQPPFGLSMRPSSPFAKYPIGYGTRIVRNLPSTSASRPSDSFPVATGTSLPTP